MADAATIRPSPVHRIAVAVFFLTALALLAQVVLMFTISDELILKVVRSSAIEQRDKDRTPFSPSDADIDRTLVEKRAELLQQAREEIRKPGVYGMKSLAAALLAALALCILSGHPSPTRLLAWLAAVLLVLVCLSLPKVAAELPSSVDAVGVPMSIPDICSVGLIPLSMILSFVVAFTWKANPTAARRWTGPPPPPPPPPPGAF